MSLAPLSRNHLGHGIIHIVPRARLNGAVTIAMPTVTYPSRLLRRISSSSPLPAQRATPTTYRFGTRSGSPRGRGRSRYRGPRGARLGRQVLLGDFELPWVGR
ncbi:hypothetical protein P171DRAFT_434013 [Karstenula rhodostoma CBS 690.94]|uniref:Uncharacterized protein n=1 Tax=Karstenula rhodostoma CBS 690.94 TaxID=1392251 RepID=A0A9P4PGG1_9PLEO|nr:hypothetical protein P171DRAFT_434013 [Karstenula rhodostoma CBS 690.94]